MRDNSFSKSTHHDCCRIRAKSSSYSEVTKVRANPTQTPTAMRHLKNPVQNFLCLLASQYLLKNRKASEETECGYGSGLRPAEAERSGLLDPDVRTRMQHCMPLLHHRQQLKRDHRPRAHLQKRVLVTHPKLHESMCDVCDACKCTSHVCDACTCTSRVKCSTNAFLLRFFCGQRQRRPLQQHIAQAGEAISVRRVQPQRTLKRTRYRQKCCWSAKMRHYAPEAVRLLWHSRFGWRWGDHICKMLRCMHWERRFQSGRIYSAA